MTAAASQVFLSSGGQVGALLRAMDWRRTRLGSAEQWPPNLRAAVGACLDDSVPTVIWWGPDFITIYNDAFASLIDGAHPMALLSPGRKAWPAGWKSVKPALEAIAARDGIATSDGAPLVMPIRAGPSAATLLLTCRPIRDETGAGGFVARLAAEMDETADIDDIVLEERHLVFLLGVERRLRTMSDPRAIRAEARRRLASHLAGEAGGVRVSFAALPGDDMPSLIEESAIDVSPLEEHGAAVTAALREGQLVQVDDARLDARTREEATRTAFSRAGVGAFIIVPLGQPGSTGTVLVARSSEPRAWSDADKATVREVANAVWSALARAQAERRLRGSEEEFRALAENLPNLCWMARADGWIYWYNRSWYDYTGTTPADMEGWGWQIVHDPALLPSVLEAWRRSIATGTRFEMVFPLRGADGVFRPFLTRIFPVRDEEGNVTRWLGNNVDISEQRDTEARLRVSEAKLRRLNETLEQQVEARTAERDRMWRLSRDVMLVARLDGVIVAVNPAWTSVLGWSEDELIGQSFLALVHPDDDRAMKETAAQLAEGKTIQRFENRYRERAGGYRWITWSAVPEGGLVHSVGRDITAEKEAAAQLEAAQERLRQAQRMEALGQLAGGIAHDFNNVLQSVTGGLGLIRSRAGDPAAVRKLADMITDVAARGASITGRLLSFGRRSDLQSVPVDPAALLEGVAEMLTHTLGSRIIVRTECPTALPHLLADKAQLETVLVNLAVNARDAMPDGGTLTIAALPEIVGAAHPNGLAAGRYIRLGVTDTGMGMDAATLKRAGEPFFTTKPIGQGTGLGLAMARGFTEQSGGAFALSSVVGEGTTVTLWLPEARDASSAMVDGTGDERTMREGTGRRVLLVDDDAIIRLLFAERLAELGWRISEAADGLAALAELERGAPVDLLVTDHAMPGMSGLVLIEEARKRQPRLPAILLTGYADAGVHEVVAGLRSGETILLHKPLSPDELALRAQGTLRVSASAAG